MSYSRPAGTAARSARTTLFAALAVVGAVLAGVLVYEWQAPSPSSAAVRVETPHSEPPTIATGIAETAGPATGAPEPKDEPVRPSQQGPVTSPESSAWSDGTVPDGVTVFDDQYPAVSNLAPDLLYALRQAATDAANDGFELIVNSGWRSREYQERLLREAVAEYGSEEEAARWVATADTSAHVSGDAVDIGPPESAAWLSERGATYGLCQIYRNEPWHFERRPGALRDGCPPMFADPTEDPRMQP